MRRIRWTEESADARADEIARRAILLMQDWGACVEFINERDLSSGAEFEHAGRYYYLLDAGMMIALCNDAIEREAIRHAVYERIYALLTAEDGPIAREVDADIRLEEI